MSYTEGNLCLVLVIPNAGELHYILGWVLPAAFQTLSCVTPQVTTNPQIRPST